MADYTYYIFDGASNSAPNFTTWHGARGDFAANNRMGAGTGVCDGGVLSFLKRGHSTTAGNFNLVAAAGISVGASGSIVIGADTGPWNASNANALAYSSSFDGQEFATDEPIETDLDKVTVQDLVLNFSLTGLAGIQNAQGADGMVFTLQRCVLVQRSNNACNVVRLRGNVIARNNLIQQMSTHASAAAVDMYRRGTVDATIEHCTIISNSANSNGFVDSTGSGATLKNVKNTYCGGATTPYGGLTPGSGCTGNSSSSTDAPGTSAVNSVAVSTTNFENVTSAGDWRVKAASALATTGATRLASALTDAYYGTSRQDPTTVGAFEALGSAPSFKAAWLPRNQSSIGSR